jgi:hypothetical protein
VYVLRTSCTWAAGGGGGGGGGRLILNFACFQALISFLVKSTPKRFLLTCTSLVYVHNYHQTPTATHHHHHYHIVIA